MRRERERDSENVERERESGKWMRMKNRIEKDWETEKGGFLYGGYGYRYTSSGGLALLSVGCPRGVRTKA